MIKMFFNTDYLVHAFNFLKHLNDKQEKEAINDIMRKKEKNTTVKKTTITTRVTKIRTICAEMLAFFALAKSHGATSQRAKTPSG